MTQVVAIVGSTDSGKTTVIEGLLPLLRARGLRVGTMKHTHHGFDFDREGSDSARHTAAGAAPVLVVGPDGGMLLTPEARRGDVGDDTLGVLVARYFADCDLVLVEGFSGEPMLKVLVHRRGIEVRDDLGSGSVIGVVTDEPLAPTGPLEHARQVGFDDLAPLADQLEGATFDEGWIVPGMLALVVDGQRIPLGDFAERMVRETILGMLGALKGLPDDPHRIDLVVRRAGDLRDRGTPSG